MIILSLDQALTKTGWSLYIDDIYTTSGILETNNGSQGMFDNILELVEKIKPNYIILEDIYLNENPKFRKAGVQEFKKLARLQGVILGICHIKDLGYYIIPPNEWKSHFNITGVRAKQKLSSKQYVKEHLNLEVTDDESDAILLGQYIIDIKE